MPTPRRLWSLAAVLSALLVGGCVSSPTPPSSVTVHVVNRISNVVVTSGDGLAVAGLRSPANDRASYIAPCVGEADVQVPIKPESAGILALLIDRSGVLDRAYPEGDLASNPTVFSVEIIWSSGELNSGDWIVVEPNGVTKSAALPASLPSSPCAPWIGEQG